MSDYEGYNKELEDYARELQEKIDKIESKPNYFSRPPSPPQTQNAIVEWQLNLDKELELIHHQIRGHVLKRNEKTNTFEWAKPDDPEQELLNEKGAQEVEKIIRNYLNKNTLLSDYKEEQIMERVKQFAHRLRRFIYMNYEDFGLTSYYKQKHFEMIVMNVVDMVESAYMRAKDGGERQSLTTIRQIIQSESVESARPIPPMMAQQKQGFFGRIFGR